MNCRRQNQSVGERQRRLCSLLINFNNVNSFNSGAQDPPIHLPLIQVL